MKFYQIHNGPVRIGASEKVLFSLASYRRRVNRVEVLKKAADSVLVALNHGLDVKAGEVIGMESAPPKDQAEQFVEVSAANAAKAWKEAIEAADKLVAGAREAAKRRRLAAERAAAPKLAETKS